MELWDLYDKNGKSLGLTARRGDKLEPGQYHLVVFAIVINSNGSFLVSKRGAHKTGGGLWEFCGGAVVAGETSFEGMRRELMEELGLEAGRDKAEAARILRHADNNPHGWIADVWVLHMDADLKSLVLQEEEVEAAVWMTRREVLDCMKSGLFFKGDLFYNKIFGASLL